VGWFFVVDWRQILVTVWWTGIRLCWTGEKY